MPEFQFQEMFPSGQDTTPYRKLSADFVGTTKFSGRDVLTVEPEALTLLTAAGVQGHLAPAAAGPSRPAQRDPRRRRGLGERQVRGAGAPEERQHLRRRRAADVPGHRHRHRHGQEGPAGLDRRRRRGGDRQGRLQDLHRDQPALLARSRRSRCSRKCRPAPTCRRRSTSMRPTATPTSSCSSPRAAARPTRATCTSRRRRC